MERVSFAVSAAAHIAALGMLVAFTVSGYEPCPPGPSDVIRVSLHAAASSLRKEGIRPPGAADDALAVSSGWPLPEETVAAASKAIASDTAIASDIAPAPSSDDREAVEGSSATVAAPDRAAPDRVVSDGAAMDGASMTENAYLAHERARALIRDMIQSRVGYPALARKRGAEGTAVAGFSISPEGRPRGVRLIRSSGHPLLDREVLRAVERASPYPALSCAVEVPVTFRMEPAR